MGVGTTMLSIGGLNFPTVWGWGGGGWPLVVREYSSIQGLNRRGGYAGQGGNGGWEFILTLTQNVFLLCGRNRSWAGADPGGGGAFQKG